MKHNRTWIIVVTLLAAALLAGGAAAGGAKVFSHKYHIGDAGADCATCHDTTKGDLPLLKNAGCKDCHDKGTPAYAPVPRPRKLHAAFPHQRHAAMKGVECKTCHAGVPDDRMDDGKPVLGFERCTACHAAKKAPVELNACKKCHGADQKKVKPADHALGWATRHGEASQWAGKDDHGKDCATCHGAGTCRACHLQSTPKDHTGLWRARMHGTAASWDRDRCKTCHETGTCVRCHAQSKPMNHVGAWKATHGLTAGATDNEHCKACHQAGWCASCHRQK